MMIFLLFLHFVNHPHHWILFPHGFLSKNTSIALKFIIESTNSRSYSQTKMNACLMYPIRQKEHNHHDCEILYWRVKDLDVNQLSQFTYLL